MIQYDSKQDKIGIDSNDPMYLVYNNGDIAYSENSESLKLFEYTKKLIKNKPTKGQIQRFYMSFLKTWDNDDNSSNMYQTYINFNGDNIHVQQRHPSYERGGMVLNDKNFTDAEQAVKFIFGTGYLSNQRWINSLQKFSIPIKYSMDYNKDRLVFK